MSPHSIAAVNELPDSEKLAVYRRFIPTPLLERFRIQPDLTDEETFNLFKTTKAQKIVQEYRSLGNGFTPQDLSQRLPSELNNFFSELFLRGDQIGEKDQKKEVGSLKKELRILSIKDEIKNITRKIKEAEVENNEDSTQELGGLLRDLTLKLSNLEKEE